MNKALEIRGLNKVYDTFALRDISFHVPKGYIMGLIGPNGAGKTTTIKSILGMVHYESGQIKVFGREGVNLGNEKIGIVMDSPLYVGDWTMSDVERAISPFYRRWDGKKYAELLKKFEIVEKKKVKELSRGMKVKLMIAVALSHDAKLLILDEPTSGLDPVARDELCDMLGDFVTDEKNSILFSTHITSDLEKIADYITLIMGGQVVFSGSKEKLLEKYVLIKGGLHEIDREQKKLVIGLREHGTGFEGIAESRNLDILPKALLIEPVTLDEIIIYLNKGARLHG